MNSQSQTRDLGTAPRKQEMRRNIRRIQKQHCNALVAGIPLLENSPGLGPVGVIRSPIIFQQQPFPSFPNRSQQLQLKPTQTANFFTFFDSISKFSISNCNQLKLGHKFEPQVELELQSNIVSVREVRARGGGLY